MQESKKQLRILCLHDKNNNAKIMKSQMQPLLLKVGENISAEYIYKSAPIVQDYEQKIQNSQQQQQQNEGQKQLIKKGQGWYTIEQTPESIKKQILNPNAPDQFFYNNIEKSFDLLHSTLDREGPFDGIIGVGQGAVMASLLCLKRNPQNTKNENKPYYFKFVIFIDATECNFSIDRQKDFKEAKDLLQKIKELQKKREELASKEKDYEIKITKLQINIQKDLLSDQQYRIEQRKILEFENRLSEVQKQIEILEGDDYDVNKLLQNCSVNMPSLHIYQKGNESAKQLKQYFIENKQKTYEFETIEKLIPEKEKKYFQQKGHEIKYKGPRNLIIPSGCVRQYISFLKNFIYMENKLLVQKSKKPAIFISSTKQKNEEDMDKSIENNNNKQDKKKDQIVVKRQFQSFNELVKSKSSQIFQKSKNECTQKYPCTYKISYISQIKTTDDKKTDSKTISDMDDYNDNSMDSDDMYRFGDFQVNNTYMCDNCKSLTRNIIQGLINEGKQRLLYSNNNQKENN